MCFLAALFFVSNTVIASSKYFWLVKLSHDLRTTVHGLARVHIPEGASNVAASMQLYQLDQNSLPRQPNTGPNPHAQNGWNIGNLIGLNWQNLRQRQLTLYNNKQYNSPYSEFAPGAHSRTSNFEHLTPKAFPYAFFCGGSGSTLSIVDLGEPFDLSSKLRNIKFAFANLDFVLESGIEIASQAASSQLITSFTNIPPPILNQIQDSPLANALNTALGAQSPETSSYDHAVAELLSSFERPAAAATMHHNIYFSPSLESYLSISPLTNSALSLVPHETLVHLGLIPNTNSEDEAHLNPDHWGEDL